MNTIIFLIMLIIPAFAQILVTSSYNKYKNIENKNKLTGFDVARKILDENNLKEMYIVETKGTLTDHYDPNQKVIRLSKQIYHDSSIASMAVAAHECGHALQDQEGYLYMRFRAFLFPIVHYMTAFSYAIIFLGILFESINMIWLGIACVASGLIFQLVTLPVEINASKRAEKELIKLKLTKENESDGVKNMLTAAASTYVAGVLTSALELIRLIMVFTKNEK